MELINEAAINSIEMLEKKVNECIENKTLIHIHMHTEHVEMNGLVTPDLFEVYPDSICLTYGRNELSINDVLDNIEYDSEENTIILHDGNMEIDIEL